MTWRVIMENVQGERLTSSALATREAAVELAKDLLRSGDLKLVEAKSDSGETIKCEDMIGSSSDAEF